jgi:hypothetical protein
MNDAFIFLCTEPTLTLSEENHKKVILLHSSNLHNFIMHPRKFFEEIFVCHLGEIYLIIQLNGPSISLDPLRSVKIALSNFLLNKFASQEKLSFIHYNENRALQHRRGKI